MISEPKATGLMQVVEEVPEKRSIFGIVAIALFVIGILLIFWDFGSSTSGPMAVSDGCCLGSLFMLCSLGLIPLALMELSRKNKPPALVYVQE
jgi:hypothetical protein